MQSASSSSGYVVWAAVIWVVLAITTVAVGLRIWVRVAITKTLGKDDAFLVASHAVNIISTACWIDVAFRLRYYAPRSPELFAALSPLMFVAFACYALASALVKIAIGLFFFKVTQRPWQRILVTVVVAVYIVTMLLCFTIIVFRCGLPLRPDRILGSDSCALGVRIEASLGLSIAALNSLCDWILAIMPVYLVLVAPRMDFVAKIATSSIIAVAVAGSVVSLVRLPYFARSSLGPSVFEHNTTVLFLSSFETAVGAIAVSLATLQPLIKIIRGSAGDKALSQEHDANAAAAPGSCATHKDWYYSAMVLRNKTVDMALLSLSKLGVLPDTIITGRALSRDEWQMPMSSRSYRPQSTILPLSKDSKRDDFTVSSVEFSSLDLLTIEPTAARQQTEGV